MYQKKKEHWAQDSASSSNITDRTGYEDLTPLDTHKQALHRETSLTSPREYHKRKRCVVVVGNSLSESSEACVYQPNRVIKGLLPVGS